ncbi:SPOR domain-containing protein [candidate division KSB1 bacterium]|nr:SPOR domain-containing protein [candidate division KSB1 bacterium]
MNNTKVIATVAALLLLVAAGFWWLQKKRAEEQAERSALIFREQPSDTARQVTPQQEIAEPSPAPSATVVVTEDGWFTVQISSWRSSEKAEREAERFQRAGYSAFVQRANLPAKGGAWYRVRVGQFRTRAEAERQAADLEVQLDTGYWITHKQ